MNRNHALISTAAISLAVAGLAPPIAAASGGSATRSHATTGGSGGTTTTTGTGGGCQGGPGDSLISGTITAIDTTAGTITVTPTSGTASVIAITASTSLFGHDTISASAIALGDTLEVSGLPVTIQAASIVDSHLPTSSTTAANVSSIGLSTGGSTVPGSLHVIGVVTALAPPTITVDSSFLVTLSVASDTTYTEVLSLTTAQLATGEAVVAHFSKSKSGTLTAVHLDVTPASS